MSSASPPLEICSTKIKDTIVACALQPLDRVGLAFVAEAGFISLSALFVLFLLILRNIWRYHKYARGTKWSLVQSPADAFVLSLFVADILQAIGASLDVRWVHRGIVEEGGYCNAQGAIQQLGETVVALAILVISVHTFLAIWMKVSMSLWVAYLIIFVYWLFVALFIGISAGKLTSYFDPTPFWCWVSRSHGKEQKAGEYAWLWIALIVSVLVYVPLFLENLGFLAVDRDYWWKVTLRWKGRSIDEDRVRKKPAKSSLAIIAYPVAYSIIVLPVSIVRWYTFKGRIVPDAATFFTVFLHDSFGAVNVALLLTTRTNRLLFEDPRRRMMMARAHSREQGGLPSVPAEDVDVDGAYTEMQEQADGRIREDDDESDESHLGAGAR